MGRIGIPELVIVFLIVLLIFGPKKLPDLAKGLGQSIRGFKDALKDDEAQPGTKSAPDHKS
jgi:sec-independent protein translocase protein TatA